MIEGKRVTCFEELASVGDYYLQDQQVVVKLPNPAGVTVLPVDTKPSKKAWFLADKDGRLTLTPSIEVFLPEVTWEGTTTPRRILWHGFLTDGRLFPV